MPPFPLLSRWRIVEDEMKTGAIRTTFLGEHLHQIDDERLIRSAADGDGPALAELFGRYRKRLRQMVRLRLDRRLQGRVDPSDVLQEAYLDVAQQLPHYLAKPEMPFFLWLRLVAGQRLMRIHREHLGRGHAGCRPRGLVVQGGLAAGQLGVAGGPAARTATRRPARPSRGPRSSSRSRRRSTAWSRSTARSSPCDTSRS